jgi:uncharacterized protein (TIGR02246 family)
VVIDPQAEQEIVAVHDAFCRGFAERDAEAVLGLFVNSGDVMCVTSEDAVLHNRAEFERFLESYIAGDTTYSWHWHTRRVGGHAGVAWLLAEGTETAADGNSQVRNAYRMTLTFVRTGGRWLLTQVHGSSPHHP